MAVVAAPGDRVSGAGDKNVIGALASADEVGIGVPTLVECGSVLSTGLKLDARGTLSRFLEADVKLYPSPLHIAGQSREGLGDCLSYATAKLAGMPLFCVCDDFSQTDMELA